MKISFTLDGQHKSVVREIADPVLEILREDCGKKEIKQGCSPQGACGSCMVVINGKPRLSCTLRAKNISNKNIQTTSSIPPRLKHILEQSFVAHGATGCGYCMPAILHQIATLLQHVPEPDEGLIDKALHMHSCPCLGFSALKKAIQAVIQSTKLPAGNLHPRGRLALWGKRARVGDISAPQLLHAIPVFSARAVCRLEKLNIPEAQSDIFVLSSQNSPAPFFQRIGENIQHTDALLALIFSEDRAKAEQFSREISAQYSEHSHSPSRAQTRSFQTNPTTPLPSKLHWVDIEENIAPQDAGYLETEACFIQKDQIIVNGIPIHSLKHRYPNHQIESWAAGGSFGGRRQDHWVDWAVHGATTLNRPVLLALSMEDSIRIRPKSPAFHLSLSLGYQKNGALQALKGSIEIDGGARPELCEGLLDTIIKNIQSLYTIPSIELQLSLISKSTAVFQPLLDQGMRAVSIGLEALIEKARMQLQMDAISIRSLNMKSNRHQKILENIREPYQTAIKMLPEEHSIGFACSSFSSSKKQVAKIQITVEETDLILIQGSQSDTGDFLEYQLIETLHQRTGIPLENIVYDVSSQYVSEPSNHFLHQKALQYACSSFFERLEEAPLSDLIGERFEGEAIYNPEEYEFDSAAGFSVSFALLSPKKHPLQIQTFSQGTIFQNTALSLAYLQGVQFRSLGIETLHYQDNLLPSLLFRQLNIPKAKESPIFTLQFQPDIIMDIEASISASVFAAMNNASKICLI